MTFSVVEKYDIVTYSAFDDFGKWLFSVEYTGTDGDGWYVKSWGAFRVIGKNGIDEWIDMEISSLHYFKKIIDKHFKNIYKNYKDK